MRQRRRFHQGHKEPYILLSPMIDLIFLLLVSPVLLPVEDPAFHNLIEILRYFPVFPLPTDTFFFQVQ